MDILVARQPIFDRRRGVFGYELLYRTPGATCFRCDDGDQASLTVIGNTFLNLGIERLTGGKRAFINFTETLLSGEVGLNLPKDLVVIEILEDLAFSEGLLDACRKLKKEGYLLALDDFLLQEHARSPMLEVVDIIKADFRGASPSDIRNLTGCLPRKGLQFLAEKVETAEEYQLACDAGYDFFQGYFFSKPELVSGKDIPGYKLNYMRMLQQLHRPEMDYLTLENTIRQDVSLSFKLLNYINSAFFGLRQTVTSIRHALALLGEREIRKWASLIVLTALGEDKPRELLMTSLVRGHFCEAIGKAIGQGGKASELFLMGIFSLLDVFMGRPLDEILTEIPLSDSIKSALKGGEGVWGNILASILGYEKGNWEAVTENAAILGVTLQMSTDLYLDAVFRSEEAMQIKH